jgi:hypothetical protein
MPKGLRIAVVSLGVFVMASAVALAQTPPPTGNDPGHKPTSTHSTPRHKSGTKKSTHKKAGKKKAPKKTAH